MAMTLSSLAAVGLFGLGCSNRATRECALQQATKQEIQNFVSTSFRAADPQLQGWCKDAMLGNLRTSSQMGQDLFLWSNFFSRATIRGEKGFYVDSGTNNAVNLSNTFFFDRCLGWSGLCVEPNAQYHEGIKAKRTCTLVKECISDTVTVLHMKQKGVSSSIKNDPKYPPIQCSPLDSMLRRSAGYAGRVSLWSLDVEGHEMIVLNGTRFESTPTDVLLIEDVHLKSRALDRLMARKRFVKAAQLPIDAVYVARNTSVCWPTEFNPIYNEEEQWQTATSYSTKMEFNAFKQAMQTQAKRPK